MIGNTTRVSTLFGLGVFLLEVALLAASPQTLSRVGASFGPSSKSQKHPKKVVLTQVVDRHFARAKGDYRFCMTYSRSAENQPDKGSMTATIELMRDDDSRKVGSISKTSVTSRRAEDCTTDGLQLEVGDILIWTFKFKSMSKVPSGDRVDLAGELLAAGDPIGRFRLAGADLDKTIDYLDQPNLVFCRTAAGFADLWIRLAEERTADGENGPHIDIDVCNYAGGGRFGPLDPAQPVCAGDKTWDIFWHEEPSAVFRNEANSSQCELRLSELEDQLHGSFSCKGLVDSEGNQVLDVVGGLFRCTVD